METLKPYLIAGAISAGAYILMDTILTEGDYDLSSVNWGKVAIVAVIGGLYAVQVKPRIEEKAFELAGIST